VKSFFESTFSIPKLPLTSVRHLVLHMFNHPQVSSFVFCRFPIFFALRQVSSFIFHLVSLFSCRDHVYSFIFHRVFSGSFLYLLSLFYSQTVFASHPIFRNISTFLSLDILYLVRHVSIYVSIFGLTIQIW
jgi:hypothetical protein